MTWKFRIGLALSLFWSLATYAQVTTGTISGTVTDSSGAVLAGAKLVIENADTGITRTVETDSSGHYSAPSLSLGQYRITGSMDGFQTEVRTGIALTVGRQAVVDLQLSVGAVTQSVEVTSEAPLVQTTESAVSYQVGGRAITELPLDGRDMVGLIVLQPGITQIQFGSSSSATDGYSKRISISGLRGEYNAYLLDGTYINDFKHHIPAGPSGSLMGVETVREFQVLTNSFSAQYGRSLGGIFSAISKSGTNEWHGDGFEFLRNSNLDARKHFDRLTVPDDPRLPPFRRNQFGGTLGGPIRKDKTFFFAAYEGLRESLGSTVTTQVLTANGRQGNLGTNGVVSVSPKIAPFLQLWPMPSSNGQDFGDGTAQYIFRDTAPTTDDFFQGRVDHQFSASDSLFARFTYSNSNTSQVDPFPGYRDNSFLRTRLATVSETHIFSPRLLSTFRVSFNRIDPGFVSIRPDGAPGQLSVAGQPFAPVMSVTGLTGVGNTMDRSRFVTNRFTYQDDTNLTLGSHAITFGGIAERMQFNQTEPDRPMGQWSFSTVGNFLQAIPSQYRGTPAVDGNPTTGVRQNFFGLYIQDDWRVLPSLTVNLGLRWDPYTVATEVNGHIANLHTIYDPMTTVGDPYWINKSMKDFGPRVGFSWSPFRSGKTAVRAGFGRFYMPIDSLTIQTRLARIYPFFPNLIFANPTHFPDALAEIAAQTQTSFGVAQSLDYNGMKTSRSVQYNLNVQQQLGANTVFIIGYSGSRGTNAMGIGDYEMPVPQWDGLSLAIPAGATIQNPAFSGIVLTAMDSNSRYNGLSMSFQRRFSAGFQTQVSYTFSKATSESDVDQVTNSVGGGGAGYAKDPYNMIAQNAPSGYNVGQVLHINYSYDLPFGRGAKGVVGHMLAGWQMTGIISAQGGQPLWITSGIPSALTALNVQTRSPNLVAGTPQSVLGNPNQWFSTAAYAFPSARELGNLGRNTLTGPGLAAWDAGLIKNTSLTEKLQLQFRAEGFNLLNRANFGAPSTAIFNSAGVLSSTAGLINTTIGSAREIQFGVKLIF